MTPFLELFSLKGETALITGAARGNGFAIAKALGLAGAKVLMVDVLSEELERAALELEGCGIAADSLAIELYPNDRIDAPITGLVDAAGGLDILVNNAGISLPSEGDSYPLENWNKTIEINLSLPFYLSTLLCDYLAQSSHGSIINITSLNAELAFPNNPAYMASKGGLKQLTKGLALDLAAKGIRVNSIGPGYMHTAMTEKSFSNPSAYEDRRSHIPLQRWGEPGDLAGTAVFLASKASAYITGQDFYVDGGWLIKGL